MRESFKLLSHSSLCGMLTSIFIAASLKELCDDSQKKVYAYYLIRHLSLNLLRVESLVEL
jgi:hypothetical protein